MMRMMERPLSVGVLQFCAVLGAILGVLYGLGVAFTALAMWQFNPWVGFLGLLPAVSIILGSIAGLGVVHGFVTIVTAAIDIRNELYARYSQE